MLKNIETQSQMMTNYKNKNSEIPMEVDYKVNNTNVEQTNKSMQYQYTNPFTSINNTSKLSNNSNDICKFDNKQILSENTELYKKSMLHAHKKLLDTKKQIDENISSITLKISEIEKL
jgi:hypothetical protein